MGPLLYTPAQHGHRSIVNVEPNDIEHGIGRERRRDVFLAFAAKKDRQITLRVISTPATAYNVQLSTPCFQCCGPYRRRKQRPHCGPNVKYRVISQPNADREKSKRGLLRIIDSRRCVLLPGKESMSRNEKRYFKELRRSV